MAKGNVPVDDGSGSKIDAQPVTRGPDTVWRQRIIPVEGFDDDLVDIIEAAAILQDVPTGLTALVTGDCRLSLVVLVNNNAAAVRTVTLQDKQGSPKKLLDAMPIAPNTPFSFLTHGVLMTSGIDWVASGAGIVGYVIARQ